MYPEGARDKYLLRSPAEPEFRSLEPSHRYLFKKSISRHPEQFWVEVACYRLGAILGVQVPPAFAALDSSTGEEGALIEWFYGYPGPVAVYISGGQIMVRRIPGFDEKKGTQHNLQDLIKTSEVYERMKLVKGSWKSYWAKCFTFDAIIGNTDRHQDNWGLILTAAENEKEDPQLTFAPAFDNGTSLGYEILEANFDRKHQNLTRYIERGRHHLRWDRIANIRIPHVDLVTHFVKHYPEVMADVEKMLAVCDEDIALALEELTHFPADTPFTSQRADFTTELTLARIHNLRSILGV